jgi:DNA repair exonuclease SbcCD ATPase subunit
MLTQLKNEFRKVEDAFLLIEADRKRKEKELETHKQERDNLVHELEICSKAIEFIEKVSTEERRGVKKKVEDLITSCLHEVFDETYSVEFEYGMKRSKTSVEVHSIRKCEDGIVVKRQIDGIGGGVADAISLPLKLIVLLNDSGLERIFVIDEPGKHLSVNHVPKFANFLNTISKKLGVQIIMSSHHTCMDKFADSINEVYLDGSKSQIVRLK